MHRRDVLRAGGRLLGGVLVASVPAAARSTPGRTDGTDVGSTATAEADFAPLGFLGVDGTREAVVGTDGSTAYVAAVDGFAIVDVSEPARPQLVAQRRGLLSDTSGGPLTQIQDVAVEGDRLLVVGPAHPDEKAVKAALLFDVSDPADPSRLAVHHTDYPIHNAALQSGHAYLTANDGEDNRLEVVVMEGDGATPAVVGQWSPGEADDAWADVPSTVTPIHDVLVHDDVAYCSYWDGGTWLVDVGDPASPSAIGRVGDRSAAELAALDAPDVEARELPGNHHSAAVDESGSLLAIGREAWDADDDGDGGPGGIDLFDVADPEAPERLSTVAPPPTPDPGFRGVWTTAHNFQLRNGVLYSAWYQGGVRVHDVADPGAPRELAAWRDSATTRFWTVRRAGSALVAASMGTEAGDAGLFTFPLPEAEPPSSGTVTSRADESPSNPARPTDRSSGPVTETPGQSGFGMAVTGLAGGLAWTLRRVR